MAPTTQVNSATGLMGTTGSGKSSLLATYARYVWATWHKVTLCYVSDGGGFPAEVQAAMALGIMRVFRMQTRDPGDLGLSFETCYRACQGWWPKRINPSTGEVEPGVEMVPPVAIRYQMYCAAGHLVKEVPSQALLLPTLCPQCKKMVSKADMRTTKTLARNKGFEEVGAVCYDGLTSMLGWELRELGHRAGRMELKGEEGAIGGKVESGTLKFGGITRSHVGFAQTRGEELVHLTLGIPNLVVPPVFTMLTHEDVDDRSLSIIGPKIAGRAKTDEAPQWFGNMLEAAKIPALAGTGEQRVLYLSEFTDQRGVRHLLKHRGSPGTMPDMLLDPANDEAPFSQCNLGVFFDQLTSALERRIADARAEIPDAPGVPEGVVEFGDSSIVVGPQPAAVAEPVQEQPAIAAASQSASPAAPAAPQGPTPVAPRPRARAKATAPQTAPVAPTAVPVQAAPSTPGPFPPANQPVSLPQQPRDLPQSPTTPSPEQPTPPHPPAPQPKPPEQPSPTPKPPIPGQPGSQLPARPMAAAPPPGRRPTPQPHARPIQAAPAQMKAPAAAPRPPATAPALAPSVPPVN